MCCDRFAMEDEKLTAAARNVVVALYVHGPMERATEEILAALRREMDAART